MLRGTYVIQMECVYRGGKAVNGADYLLKRFHDEKIRYVLISEQSGSDRASIAERMQEAGLPYVKAQNIFTGAYGACAYLRWRYPDKTKIYSVGGHGIRDAMNVFHLEEERRHPDYVLMGLDREMTYSDYNDIVHVLRNGAGLVSVDDRIVQFNEEEADLGNGSIIRMLEYASGVKAMSFGRGSERMYRRCASYMGISPEDMLVAGSDFRLDILPAIKLKATTFLVSGGHDITKCGITESLHPDYIVDDVSGIAK